MYNCSKNSHPCLKCLPGFPCAARMSRRGRCHSCQLIHSRPMLKNFYSRPPWSGPAFYTRLASSRLPLGMKKLGRLRKKPSNTEAGTHAFLLLAAPRLTTASEPAQFHQKTPASTWPKQAARRPLQLPVSSIAMLGDGRAPISGAHHQS